MDEVEWIHGRAPLGRQGGLWRVAVFPRPFIRVFSIGALDLLALPKQLFFKLYIDDSSLSATGSSDYILTHLPPAVEQLHAALQEGVGAVVSDDPGKRSLICSSRVLGKKLGERLGGLAGPLVSY